jgi:RNA polymerase sigma-70 factor (ECF subfamily)
MPDASLHTVQLHHWLDRIRAGDDEARDELIRMVCNRLERLARKMLKRFPNVRRWAETDDILQNALMRLLRSLQKLQPESVRAFFGLAAEEIRRELIDLARHYYGPEGIGAHHYSLGADANNRRGPALEPAAEPTGDGGDLERWCRFHQEVEKLPTEHREVVSLVFYHGWTQEQVAELFQVNVRTIRRRWQESLLRLREALNGALTPE